MVIFSAMGQLMAQRVVAGKMTFDEVAPKLKEDCAKILLEMGRGDLVPVDFGGTMEG